MSGARRPLEVSVIVPARNAERTLGPLLDALEDQTADRDSFEVLVIDDGSNDATAELARARGWVRVMSSAGRGVYAARNTGIAEAGAPALAFTDADCVPARDWVQRGRTRLEAGRATVVAGRIEVALRPRHGITAMLDASHYYDQERYADEGHAAAGNLWLAADVVRTVGGFDARLRSGGDTEFGRRVCEAGHEIVYAADVTVRHPPLTRPSQLIRRCFRLGRGAVARGRGNVRERRSRGAYVTTGAMLDRLTALGQPPSRREQLALLVAKQALIRAPLVLGNISARLQHRAHARAEDG